MAGLVWGKLVSWQFRPLRSCSQNPKHSLEDPSRVRPRSSRALARRVRCQQRLQHFPLRIGEFHTYRCACKSNFAQLLSAVHIYEIGSRYCPSIPSVRRTEWLTSRHETLANSQWFLLPRRSSCLRFQICRVETPSLLPKCQSNGRDLARQRYASHLWLHPLGQ